jgi:hypothetical protein
MKIGSEAHKELFCQSFMDSHLLYEPEILAWPELDRAMIERLQKIPFWDEALYTERKAGVMLKAYAETVEDPMIQAAIALQAEEEARHGRVIGYMINHYGIQVPERAAKPLPENLEPAFIKFGYGECFDSFFAFGLFGIARQGGFIPDALFNIFNTLVDEEARHMVFFVNWIAHKQIVEGRGALRPFSSFQQYTGAAFRRLDNLMGMSKKGKKKPANQKGFTAAGAKAVKVDLTLESFLQMCITENARRMAAYPEDLLRPDFLPAIASLAYNTVKRLPKRDRQPAEEIGARG